MPTASGAPTRPLVNLARTPGVLATQSSNYRCGYTPKSPIEVPDEKGCYNDAYLACQGCNANNDFLDASEKALGYTYGAQNAIDGSTTGQYTHTQSQFAEIAWWRIDFGPLSLNEILTVNITNRVDCCQGRLRNFTVDVLDEHENVVSSIYYENSVDASLALEFPDAPRGRFVQLTLLDLGNILRK